MKKLSIKRSLTLAGFALSGILSSTLSYADLQASSNQSGGGNEIVAAIQALGLEINSLATAGANALSDAVYQFDQNLPGIVQTNSGSANLRSEVEANASTQTLANIQASLQTFPQQVVPPQDRPNPVQALTYGIPSSDTLYSPKDPQAQVFNANPESKPNHDAFFSMDSLIGPDAYSSEQLDAAQYYLQFLTQSYMPLSNIIDFKPLAGLSYEAFGNFQRNNTAYQNYQASVRSYMALTSVGLSNFNALIAERSVQTGLGTAVGLLDPSEDGHGPQPVADASPFQVQEYIATHRINDVQWYKDMAAASPVTIQRESLFVFAEMEAQLQQLHADNERLLATLSALELATAQGQKPALATQETTVNSAIAAATGSDTVSQNPTLNQQPQDSTLNQQNIPVFNQQQPGQ